MTNLQQRILTHEINEKQLMKDITKAVMNEFDFVEVVNMNTLGYIRYVIAGIEYSSMSMKAHPSIESTCPVEQPDMSDEELMKLIKAKRAAGPQSELVHDWLLVRVFPEYN